MGKINWGGLKMEDFVKEHWDNGNLNRSFIIDQLKEDDSWKERDWQFLTIGLKQRIVNMVEESIGGN